MYYIVGETSPDGFNAISEQQLESYKETISSQAYEINQLKHQLSDFNNSKTTLQKQVMDLEERLKSMVKI